MVIASRNLLHVLVKDSINPPYHSWIQMNILFTGAGRRDYIMEDFRDVLQPLGGAVYAMNSHAWSPAFQLADHSVVSPPASDTAFPDFLLEFCKIHHIDALLTLIDTDMQVLSILRNELAALGTRLILPSEEVLHICRDKVKLNGWLHELGLAGIQTYTNLQEALIALRSGRISFPLIIKPRRGTGSLSTYRVCDEEELIVLFRRALREIEASPLSKESGYVFEEALIIQEFIHGIEYGLDIVNNLSGKFQSVIVKEKISMRAGETDIARIVDFPELARIGETIALNLQHPYLLDVDLMLNEGVSYVMDMNPRISGGFPFSRMAGVRYPEALVRWLQHDDEDLASLLIPEIGKLSMKGLSIRCAVSVDQIISASPLPHSHA